MRLFWISESIKKDHRSRTYAREYNKERDDYYGPPKIGTEWLRKPPFLTVEKTAYDELRTALEAIYLKCGKVESDYMKETEGAKYQAEISHIWMICDQALKPKAVAT